jgi:hypothetical protein
MIMSNETIAKRILEVCNQFADKQISVLELGRNITAHGTALENKNTELEELLIAFDSRCEEINMEHHPKHQYEKCMPLISKLKRVLANNYPTITEAQPSTNN